MKDYSGYTDEELIIRLRDGEDAVTDFIMEKYKGLVKSKAKSMYILGADTEDLIQEGMIGLFKAVRDYDCGRDASFYTFAELCVSRQMYTAVRASGRKKHSPLNGYISLYGSEGDDMPLANLLPTVDSGNPETMVIDRENLENLEQVIEEQLSQMEKDVLDLHMTGMSYTEIAKVLGRDLKSTDNALQRIRTKIKKYLLPH